MNWFMAVHIYVYIINTASKRHKKDTIGDCGRLKKHLKLTEGGRKARGKEHVKTQTIYMKMKLAEEKQGNSQVFAYFQIYLR